MHKPEKSFLTYKESYQYGETYKKFTVPVFCSTLAINLNYSAFEVNQMQNYKEAKEKLIDVLGDDFFELLEQINTTELKNSYRRIKKEILLIYTLIKRLDYNYIFLYYIPYFVKQTLEITTDSEWMNKINLLIRSYIENGIYEIDSIFEKQETLQIYYQYICKKNDQVKEEFFKTIFCYDLFFTSLKEKYYFYSSDGKIDFTHLFYRFFLTLTILIYLKNEPKKIDIYHIFLKLLDQ